MNQEIRDHIQYNLSSEDYRTAPLISDSYPPQVNWEKLPKHIIEAAEENIEIFRLCSELRKETNRPMVGDWIKQPNGERVRIAYVWGNMPHDNIQTAHGGSFHLFRTGTADMSGSLDAGLKRGELRDTQTFEDAEFWIFSRADIGANRGVYHKIPTRVWAASVNIEK